MSASAISIFDYANTPEFEFVAVSQLASNAILNEVLDHDIFMLRADEYNKLLKDSQMLQALLKSGVEKWWKWDKAVRKYKKMEEENEDAT